MSEIPEKDLTFVPVNEDTPVINVCISLEFIEGGSLILRKPMLKGLYDNIVSVNNEGPLNGFNLSLGTLQILTVPFSIKNFEILEEN